MEAAAATVPRGMPSVPGSLREVEGVDQGFSTVM
jgi:hypothetical protein